MDQNMIDYKKKILEKCPYFNMRAVCEKADINYSTFRGWRNNGRSFSDKKARQLYETMLSIMNEE